MNRNIKMSDIANAKLIGFSKNRPIPKPLEKYVSIFDFEAETLRAPVYSGHIIEEILTTKKQWPNEETYLAFIQTILFEISMKACMYYHLCCVGASNSDLVPQPEETEDVQLETKRNSGNANTGDYGSLQFGIKKGSTGRDRRSYSDSQLTLKLLPFSGPAEHSKEMFFKKMNFEATDIEIIEYLAEVVKEQQCVQIHGAHKLIPIIRLDYTSTQLFKNIKKP